jgi:DNA-binding PadR family transcriptional regulator
MQRTRRLSPQTAAVVDVLFEHGPEWTYGYQLCRRLGLKAGTVYPILMRLAERGQVETSWEQEPPRGRPPRHLYRLSPDGVVLARQLRAQRAPVGDVVPRVRGSEIGRATT